MIHTYSLIHDDLPALDNDDLRRGVPTCHVVFGEATAILAGDCAADARPRRLRARIRRGSSFAAAKVRVLETVVDAIGTQGMIGGQMADLEAETESARRRPSCLTRIHENKTGRLMRASLSAGAILAGADEATLERVDLYGRRIGLAFQIKDDLLDVESDAATLGKASEQGRRGGQGDVPGRLGRRAIDAAPRGERRRGRRRRLGASGRRGRPAGSRALRRLPQVVTAGVERPSALRPASLSPRPRQPFDR